MPVLTHVEFRGRKAIRLKEIEDTTGLKKGNRADSTRTRNAVHSILPALPGEGLRPGRGRAARGGQPRRHQGRDPDLRGAQGQDRQHQLRRLPVRLGGDAEDPHRQPRQPILGLFGKYHRDMLDEDRQKLIDYYQGLGFFEAKVTPVTRPGNEPGEIDLTFVIHEGTRYSVRNVIIEGNSKLKTERADGGPGAALGQAVPADGARRRQEPHPDQVQRDRLHRHRGRRRAAVHQPARRRGPAVQDRARASRTCWASWRSRGTTGPRTR